MITILGKVIPSYGICLFIGIVISILIALILINIKKVDIFDFLSCSSYLLIGAIVGAKLLFILVSIDVIIENNLGILDILKGGFVFYGGLIGGIIGVVIYGKQFKTSIKKYLDISATVLPLGHSIGRIGCYLSGCCYGIEYDGVFSHIYYEAANAFTPLGIKLFPIQLLEAILLFILFVVLLYISFKSKPEGNTAIIYLISYAIIRFFLEFLRGDVERGSFLYLSTSQWISLLIILISIIYFRKNRFKKKEKTNEK